MTTTPSNHVYRANGGELALRPPFSDVPPDEPLEARRYVDAFRRSWPLILLIVVPLTVLVFVVSALFPKTYSSSAKLVLDTTGNPLEASDAASVQRRRRPQQAVAHLRHGSLHAVEDVPTHDNSLAHADMLPGPGAAASGVWSLRFGSR